MNNEDIFLVWGPEKSRWSPWVKPVLFAHLQSSESEIPGEPDFQNWIPAASGEVALVINLPGAEGVLAGVALAERGYRPVPLYNAVPLPMVPAIPPSLGGIAVAAVKVFPILNALQRTTEKLAKLDLPLDAPPAFLLDYDRQGDGRKIGRGEFDNRSVSFTTDFPSANFFSAQGIGRIVLIQKESAAIQSDLAHSLRRWQDGGLRLERFVFNNPGALELFSIDRPSWYGAMFQRVLCQLGLRRSGGGGFGGWIPDSSSGG